MKTIKVMTVFGTRPEAIKMAPLIHALEQAPDLESVVCVTAQHREMLDQVMDIFHLKADYDLNIMQPRQTLATITTKSLVGLDTVLDEAKPDKLAENPKLYKTPIVRNGRSATTGYCPEIWKNWE